MQVPALTRGYKGQFFPRFPKKYKGDINKIVWRSTWERKVMMMLDSNRNVLEWSSEELEIPYFSPVDKTWHRYFPDFVAKVIKPNNKVVTQVIEVKPYKQTIEPDMRKKKTRKLMIEAATYAINDAKWTSAREYCADRGWEFVIVTEADIGITY
jgi:hypothetical protein